MKVNFHLSLRNILTLIILALTIPPIFLNIFSAYRASAQKSEFSQLKNDITEIDTEINLNILGSFYLSPSDYDPCLLNTQLMIETPPNWRIRSEPSRDFNSICKWIYLKDGKVTAIDYWGEYNRILVAREHFLGNEKAAVTDRFNLGDYACVKKRQYTKSNITECYLESGKIVSIDATDESFSPIPPMLYWFFYR